MAEDRRERHKKILEKDKVFGIKLWVKTLRMPAIVCISLSIPLFLFSLYLLSNAYYSFLRLFHPISCLSSLSSTYIFKHKVSHIPQLTQVSFASVCFVFLERNIKSKRYIMSRCFTLCLASGPDYGLENCRGLVDSLWPWALRRCSLLSLILMFLFSLFRNWTQSEIISLSLSFSLSFESMLERMCFSFVSSFVLSLTLSFLFSFLSLSLSLFLSLSHVCIEILPVLFFYFGATLTRLIEKCALKVWISDLLCFLKLLSWRRRSRTFWRRLFYSLLNKTRKLSFRAKRSLWSTIQWFVCLSSLF